MDTRKRVLTGTNATATVVFIIIAAVLLNVFVSQNPVTIDLTDDKIYTLSEASVEAVAGLEEPVEVKVFISPDMPPPFHTLSQQVKDLLADYEARSNGKLTYEIISPDADDKEAEEAAAGFGINKVGLGLQTEDQKSLRLVYAGAAFVQGENTQVVSDLRQGGIGQQNQFEYLFTKALLNLRSTEPRKVAFLAGFGGPAANPQMAESLKPTFQELYGDLIQVTSVDLSTETKIPDDVNALIVMNVDQVVSEKAKFAIDQFVQRGGSVGWFQSASVPDVQLQQQLMQQMGNRQVPDIRKQVDTGLVELFATYGLEYRGDVILDRERGIASIIQTQAGLAQVSHPATYLIDDLDRSAPFMSTLRAVTMPAPSSVGIRPEVQEDESLEVYELAKTAPTSVRRPEPPTSYNFQQFAQPVEGEQPGAYVVAAAIQGKVGSYFADKPLPEGVSEEDVVKDAAPARVMVVGSGDLVTLRPDLAYNQNIARFGMQFFFNSLEWLVQDNALTQVRGKSMPRLIGEVPRELQRQIQFINIAMVPAIFALLGYIVLVIRRRRRDSFEI